MFKPLTPKLTTGLVKVILLTSFEASRDIELLAEAHEVCVPTLSVSTLVRLCLFPLRSTAEAIHRGKGMWRIKVRRRPWSIHILAKGNTSLKIPRNP